jgi:WD40 repeat protein
MSRDGGRVLVNKNRDYSAILDVASGAMQPIERRPGWEAPLLSPDGKWYVETFEDRVRVSDAATNKVAFTQELADVGRAFFTPNGERVVAFSTSGAREWRLPSGEPIPVAAVDGLDVEEVDSTGERFIMSTKVGEARIVDAASGRTLTTLATNADVVWAKIDLADRVVVTQADTRTVEVWDAATGSRLLTVVGVAEAAFAITDDGKRLATGYDDGVVRIWDIASGRVVQATRAHRKSVSGLWFALGDTRVVATGDTQAAILDVHLEQRSPAEIADLASRYSGWVLQGGQLVRK